MIIRRARPDDEREVRRCVREAFSKYVSRIGKEPAPMQADFSKDIERGVIDVAEIDGSIVGCVTYFPSGNKMHLSIVAVRPSSAGKNIGRQLICHVEQQASQMEVEVVELYTNSAMAENLDLYPRLGYVEVGRRFEAGFSRVYFEKKLSERSAGAV